MQSIKWIKGVECNQTRKEVDCETKGSNSYRRLNIPKHLKNPKALMLIGNKQKTEGMKLIKLKNNPKALNAYLK